MVRDKKMKYCVTLIIIAMWISCGFVANKKGNDETAIIAASVITFLIGLGYFIIKNTN